MKTVAINGFGRIGRLVFRILVEEPNYQVVAINANYTPEQLGHLIQYDSVHGKFPCDISYTEKAIIINGQTIHIVNERSPENLPWQSLGVDYVVESTGAFRTKETCEKHIQAGAKKVILTAPPKDDMKMIVMGVNEETYNGESIVSNASCTTNCLGPVVKVLDETFGIQNGLVTTIHAMTNDQRMIDNMHKDLRRARAGGLNMIPTSTGAAKAIGEILPQLKGKLNGMAIRVPTHDVSIVDLVLDLKKETTKKEINEVLKKASEASNGILAYSDLPLVSSDYTTDPYSATVDGLSTMVMEGKKVKIIAWYDNEWGYSKRIVDLLTHISN